MKKILFPATNRVHLARQMPLLDKLSEYFEVCVAVYGEKEMTMPEIAADMATKFQKRLEEVKPDLILIRGDRFELLPIAMIGAYNGIKIAQIEAGDLSGVIDNKVRYAISHLADYHFVTNWESEQRMRNIGFSEVFNVGSLDVEFAINVKGSELSSKPYIMVLWHPTPFEPESILIKALEDPIFQGLEIIGIKGNKDYGFTSSYKESFSPEEFIILLEGARCLIGNSSAGIKEAGILGTPVVNIGTRQDNRLKANNVTDCEHEVDSIIGAVKRQLKHGKYESDYSYYQENTSSKMVDIIKGLVF